MNENKVVRKVDFEGVSDDEMLQELSNRFFAFVAVGMKIGLDGKNSDHGYWYKGHPVVCLGLLSTIESKINGDILNMQKPTKEFDSLVGGG